jgi:hypothetical protein
MLAPRNQIGADLDLFEVGKEYAVHAPCQQPREAGGPAQSWPQRVKQRTRAPSRRTIIR